MFHVFSYFTILNALAVFVLGPIVYPYINLLMTSLFTFVVGSYVFWVTPGYVKVQLFGKTHTIDGVYEKLVCDALGHVLPLVVVLYWYLPKYQQDPPMCASSMTLTAILILLYILAVDVKRLYDVQDQALNACAVLTVVTFLMILSKI